MFLIQFKDLNLTYFWKYKQTIKKKWRKLYLQIHMITGNVVNYRKCLCLFLWALFLAFGLLLGVLAVNTSVVVVVVGSVSSISNVWSIFSSVLDSLNVSVTELISGVIDDFDCCGLCLGCETFLGLCFLCNFGLLVVDGFSAGMFW